MRVTRPFGAVASGIYERFIAAAARDAVAPTIVASMHPDRDVLDVGAGGGVIAELLRAEHGKHVVAVDASLVQARRARGVAASALALPFRDERFDTVIASCSIKHWPDPAAGVAECDRVLRPGGVLVVVEMDRDATLDDMRRFAAMTTWPRPVRRLYARADHRAVLPTAPTSAELSGWVGAPVTKIAGQPYQVATRARRLVSPRP